MSEDHQPNETRLSRKGNHIVPTVRTNTKPCIRPFPGSHNNYPPKRLRVHDSVISSTSKFKYPHPRQGAGASDVTKGLNDSHQFHHRAGLWWERSKGVSTTIRDRSKSIRTAKSVTINPNLVQSKPIQPPLINSSTSTPFSLDIGVPPPKNTQIQSSMTPSRPFRSPVHHSITSTSTPTPAGPPRFRSGKITINTDGTASTQYNKVSNSSSFWKTAPLYQSYSPSSVEIEQTPDNDDTFDPNRLVASIPGSPGHTRLPSPEFPTTVNTSPSDIELRSDPPRVRLSLGSICSGQLYNLPKHGHDKPRRLLAFFDGDDVVNVSMHGFIDKVCIKPAKQRHPIRAPQDPFREMVNDACVIAAFNSPLLVLGHARDKNQVSLFDSDNQSIRHIGSFNRQARGERNNGVSTICAMQQPLVFATGGFDHNVNIWSVEEDLSPTCGLPLTIKHSALVQSLLSIRDSSHKLLSAGADCNVNIYDLSPERVVNTVKTSNSVHHIHRTVSPYCTLFQVAHREYQFEVRDHRLVPKEPVQRFGFDSNNYKLGRYAKGDVNSNLFAYGDQDGCVRIWDLRNVQDPLANVSCLTGKIVHVMFHQSRLIASSEENNIASFSYSQSNT